MRYKELEKSIDDLRRGNMDSDIITFYKQVTKTARPIIIDLIGARGAGKTTFCQQFVNEEGNRLLSKTISTSGNSNIMKTDIVILKETKSRLFLKARTKSDIIRDLILVALSIDPEYQFDIKKGITDAANKAGVKKFNEKGTNINIELFQNVYNLVRTVILLSKFQEIAKELQQNLKKKDDIEEYIDINISNENITLLLENIIYSKLAINNFYGHRHEISLDRDNILEKTIVPTNIFNKHREGLKEFYEVVSLRLLFEKATIVLKCNERSKHNLQQKFSNGVVFRILEEFKKVDEQEILESNLNVKYRMLLVTAATGIELVDEKFVDELKNMISSSSTQNIVVITKIDKISSYEEYTQNNYDAFIESLKQQVATTHNKIIDKLEETQERTACGTCKLTKDRISKKIFSAFDNAYLSKITKDKHGNYDAEIHKIVCKNSSNKEILANDIEDIIILENWNTSVSNSLNQEARTMKFSFFIKKIFEIYTMGVICGTATLIEKLLVTV